jgi:ABC-2 type transport system permease protein
VAELDERRATPLTQAAPDIPAATHLLIIAWLRWRMLVNSFMRRQANPGQVAGLVLTIVLRVILWPILAMMAIGPAFAAGFFAWAAVHEHRPQRLAMVLAAVAVFWQFVAVNGVSIAAQVSNFDPSSLLRFPLRFGRYLVLRLLLGLLTPSTIIGCLALLAAVIGISIADPSLAPAAVVVLGVYAAMNIFFSRMIGVWLERWLATRRAREVFGVLMAVIFFGVQYFNYSHMGSRSHRAASGNWVLNLLQGSDHLLAWLPPGFATNAILLGAHPLTRLAQFAALLLWTAAFLAAFAARLHKQFLGEYLAEGPPRSAASSAPKPQPQPLAAASSDEPESTLLPPALAACLRKEWLYLRGNGALVVGLLTPLIFVFIFSKGMLAHHPSYLLSGAVGYALMGPMAALYNIFGADGSGVQLYLLAPARLRDVVVAKNIVGLAVLLTEAALAWSIVVATASAPIALSTQISTALWIVFILFTNLTLGTLRSVQAPRKVAAAQARSMRSTPGSKTSALIVLAILFSSILLQVPVTLLCRHFHNPWLAVAIFAPLAAAAIAAYGVLLANADGLILTHRDLFAEELYAG